MAVNLYFHERKTVLRYTTTDGIRERCVAFPAALLTQPPDPTAMIRPRVMTSMAELLFLAFRQMPLAPQLDWRLAEDGFSPVTRQAFDALLRMLRQAPEQRWCVRGEPGWFLQFALRESTGDYTMGALVRPCGKPAVLTFRAEDCIRALPPTSPFATMSVTSVADGLPAQTDDSLGWDTRIRLPIADNGAAIITLHPQS